MPVAPRHIRVFLSSPGDVPEERALAAKVLDDLPRDPLLKGKVTIEVVAWDQPGSATPMLATMTPQEAINQGMPLPADCDIVIVIFWARMGTPLPDDYKKPDGTRYQSGTEWEYLNAVEAAQQSAKRGDKLPRPQVVIYRRTEEPVIGLRDPKRADKIAQWERVEAFFADFTAPDGAIRRGVNPYKTPDDFRQQFESHLKKLIDRFLSIPQNVGTTPALSEQGSEEKDLWPGSPFPGLRAFTPDDAPIFYGRGAETDALIEKLRTSRVVAVVGASGSGKSSLAGAGLLPRLSENGIQGSKDWILPGRGGDAPNRTWVGLRFTPGEVSADPFMALALKLGPMTGHPPRELAAELADKPESLPELLAPLFVGRPEWSEALLFIDQFEELFTLVDQNKREPFVRLLLSIAESKRLRAVLTLRADFSPRCTENATLAALFTAGTFMLAAPGTVALSEMIARPADRAGLTFAPGLVDTILKDTGDDPGALALLAYLLDELYKQRSPDGKLTAAAYKSLGGVQGAIGKRAEETVAKLTPDQAAALPKLFNEIVEVDARGEPTRRRAPLDRLVSDPTVAGLIDALTDARLLVQDEGEGRRAVVEVAHEALLRQWPRLAEWIVSAEADLRLRRQLEQASHDWQSAPADRKAEFVLLGSRLEEAQRWQERTAPEPFVAEFIDASASYQADQQAAREQQKNEFEAAKTEAANANERWRRNRRELVRAFIVGVAGFALLAILTYVGVTNANNQLQQADNTLTPVPQTLIAAQATARNAQQQVATAQILIAAVNATLTPIPPTLTAVAQQISSGQAIIESQRLAGLADNQLLAAPPAGNIETAALLGIRALKANYTSQADASLAGALGRVYTHQIFTSPDRFAILDANFSADGRYVATGDENGIIRVWDTTTERVIRTFDNRSTPSSGQSTAPNYVYSVVFSPDGRYLLAGSADGNARLWNLNAGKVTKSFSGGVAAILSVTFSHDGRFALTGGGDGVVRLWDIADGLLMRSFTKDEIPVLSVAFSPDDRYVLAGGRDALGWLWDAGSGQVIRTFAGHTDVVASAVFSADGRYVVTGSYDATARIWKVATGQNIGTLRGHNGIINSVAVSPDGFYVLTGSADGTARLWDVRTGQTVRILSGHTADVRSVAFSPDGRYALTASNDGTARLWDVDVNNSQRPRIMSWGNVALTSLGLSPNGQMIAVGDGDGTLRLLRWDAKDPDHTEVTQTLAVHTNAISGVAFSPDGRYLVTGSWDKTVRLWNTSNGQVLWTFTGFVSFVSSVALSPDGKYILAGGYDGTGRLLDVSSGQLIRTLVDKNIGAVFSVAFSPDDRYVALGAEKEVEIQDVLNGQKVGGHVTTRAVTAVKFSPDSRSLLTGGADGTVQLWAINTGQSLLTPIRPFVGHTDVILNVDFSSDGNRIVTASADGTARVWDINSSNVDRVLDVFNVTSGSVTGVIFSPDGQYIFTGNQDGTLRLWDTDYHDFIAYACTQVWRDFTDTERQRFGIADHDPTCPQFAPDATALPTITPIQEMWTPIPLSPSPNWTPLPTLVPSATDTPGPSPTEPPTLTPTITLTPSATETLAITPFTPRPLPEWTPIASPTGQ